MRVPVTIPAARSAKGAAWMFETSEESRAEVEQITAAKAFIYRVRP